MRTIRGKIALVTGAASGIGRALTLELARAGAQLYLLDVNEFGLAEVVSLAKREGVEVIGRRCDVSQPSEISGSVKDVLDRWGKVDLLINNAGITYYGKTDAMTADNWQQMLAINLQAPIQFTHELLPTLLQQDEAHILNVASILGLVGLARVAAYSTSKFGLVGFSESLRAEYGRRGLGVTALCPGLVDTNLFSAAQLGQDRQEPKQPPSFLLATPEKIAACAVRAIRKNKRVVVLQPYARLLHTTKRFVPGLLDWLQNLSRPRFSRKNGPQRSSSEVPATSSRRAA